MTLTCTVYAPVGIGGSAAWTVCVTPLRTCACLLDEPGCHDVEQHGGTRLNPTIIQPDGAGRSGTDLPPTDCPVQSADWTGTGWSPGYQDQPPGCPCGHDADEHGRCVVPYPPQMKCFTVYDILQTSSAAVDRTSQPLLCTAASAVMT